MIRSSVFCFWVEVPSNSCQPQAAYGAMQPQMAQMQRPGKVSTHGCGDVSLSVAAVVAVAGNRSSGARPRIFHHFWWARCQLPRLVLVMANLHTVPKRHRDSQHVQYKNVSFGVSTAHCLVYHDTSRLIFSSFEYFWVISEYMQVITKLYQHRPPVYAAVFGRIGEPMKACPLLKASGPLIRWRRFLAEVYQGCRVFQHGHVCCVFFWSEGNLFWRCWSGCFCTCFCWS